MSLNSKKVIGIRVLDIAEEGATAIENMVNKVIQELDKQETPIIDLQVTETNCFLILGEKNLNVLHVELVFESFLKLKIY